VEQERLDLEGRSPCSRTCAFSQARAPATAASSRGSMDAGSRRRICSIEAWIRDPRSIAVVESVVRYFTAASTLPASRSATRRSAFSTADRATSPSFQLVSAGASSTRVMDVTPGHGPWPLK